MVVSVSTMQLAKAFAHSIDTYTEIRDDFFVRGAVKGVLEMVRGQLVSVIVACALAAVALTAVSSAGGVLAGMRALAWVLPAAPVMILARAACNQARPVGEFYRSGWPREGSLLRGSALIFTVSSLSAFAYLAAVGAVGDVVLAMLVGMLVLGNAYFGFFALMSHQQRERD